jgi:hypothetical protein
MMHNNSYKNLWFQYALPQLAENYFMVSIPAPATCGKRFYGQIINQI